MRRKWRTLLAGWVPLVLVATMSALGSPTRAVADPLPLAGPRTPASVAPQDRLSDPDGVLPAGWRSSPDRAVTVAGDATGLHVLVADEATGYVWRTVATLGEPGYDTDEWIGQDCVTGSGRTAVVVYAPRQFTNREAAFDAGAFVATVDLVTGAVRKLALHASLAYYNPGCGVSEQVAVSALRIGDGDAASEESTVDATSGTVARTTRTVGQLSSAVPYGNGLAAVQGNRLVSVDASGATRALATLPWVPFRLHPDRGGGLAFEVPYRDGSGDRVEVQRYANGRAQSLGAGRLDSVRLAASAGGLFVTGSDAGRITVPDGIGWRRLGGHVDDQPSTTGTLVLTSVNNHAAPSAAAAAVGQLHSPDRTDPVYVQATLTAGGRGVSWRVDPASSAAGMSGTAGHQASPALGDGSPGSAKPQTATPNAVTPNVVDGSTVPWDPDRGCAVPRNDNTKQAFQATAQQVEWAADLAVQGALTMFRPANFRDSGMPAAWSPQQLFPLHQLVGSNHHVPAQVLLGLLAQESNTMQASFHAVDGITGNFNQGGFYGNGSSWSTVDCGYGAGQITTGMSIAEGTRVYTADRQLAIATDYASNIAASLDALVDAWNSLKVDNIVANDGNPDYVENWWFALWAYNSGIQPDAAHGNTTGCIPGPSCNDGSGNWGVGWANNPANPNYPVDRHIFHSSDDDTKTPNLWPYEELVMGWAKTPLARYNYADSAWESAYLPEARGTGGIDPNPAHTTFCTTAANHCVPGGANDLHGKPGAGLCQLSNLHCWWHQSITWTGCSLICSKEVIRFAPGAPEPGSTDIYPADCSTSGLPTGTVIVDDVTTPSAAPCNKTWTDQGSFSLYFPPSSAPGCMTNCIQYQGKIDFHQLGVGFGGHVWFTHLGDLSQVTATWRPPSTVTGWRRIKVHIPDNGATTEMADYQINLGNGQFRHRLVNQDWWHNTWVDLGTFNLTAGASVSLSNSNAYVAGGRADGRDIAFDAVAFIPSSQPYARYVALGDSYSSGDGMSPYESDSDQYNSGNPDACHRSPRAYPNLVQLPGHASTIAADAAANHADFHSLACGGAPSVALTAAAVDVNNTWNTDWGVANYYRNGEPYQIDAGGWLDTDTTLVTITAGGIDARFIDVLIGCVGSASDCTDPAFYLTRFDSKKVDPEPLITYEPKVINALRSHLASVYTAIHALAPNARVVVLGYPRLFDDQPSVCLTAGLTANQQLWLNQMADLLTQSIRGAVSDAHTQTGMAISFVDSTPGFTNHRVCDATNWINAITGPTQTGSSGPNPELPGVGSFHPTPDGHRELATVLNVTL